MTSGHRHLASLLSLLGLGLLALGSNGGSLEPLPPALGQIVVENPTRLSGSTSPTDLVSNLDNPAIRMVVPLNQVDTMWGGIRPQQITGIGSTVNFHNGDMKVYSTGGNGQPDPVDDQSHRLMAVVEDLIPWPKPTATDVQGIDFFAPEPADLWARGLRIGYTPVQLEVRATLPNYTRGPVLAQASVRLDPGVNLVPIEVVVLRSAANPNATYPASVQGQLHLWDQTQDIVNYLTTPELKVTSRTFVAWDDNPSIVGSWEPPFVAYKSKSGYYTPDSVWRQCGVQFRMVNYFVLDVEDYYNYIDSSTHHWDGTSDGDTPCKDLKRFIKADPRHVAGVPIVIFNAKYSFLGDLAELARSIDNKSAPYTTKDATVCAPISTSWPNVLAHEIGHMSGLDDCANCACKSQMMCSTYGGQPGPDQNECHQMRAFSSLFASFWQ